MPPLLFQSYYIDTVMFLLKSLFPYLLFFLVALIHSIPAHSYPQFIGKGYTSCVTCHYNPFGNGPLNNYGRGVSAVAVASKALFHPAYPEEKLSNRSSFFFNKPGKSRFEPSLDYRGLLLKNNYGGENEQTTYINMQFDGQMVIRLDSENKLFFSGQIGYAPRPRSQEKSNREIKEYRTREHYIGYRPKSNFGVYAGLQDKIFGVRTSEHSSFARSTNNLSQNDQSHGLQVHGQWKRLEGGLGYFLGNLVQDDDLRQKGLSGKLNYLFPGKATLGGSYLTSKSDHLKMNSWALHHKTAVGRGSAIIVELGKVKKESLTAGGTNKDAKYGLAQAYLQMKKGYYFINTLEYLSETSEGQPKDYKIRFGPGVQAFPLQRVELRVDIQNTRNFSNTNSTKDTWDFLGQVHLWF